MALWWSRVGGGGGGWGWLLLACCLAGGAWTKGVESGGWGCGGVVVVVAGTLPDCLPATSPLPVFACPTALCCCFWAFLLLHAGTAGMYDESLRCWQHGCTAVNAVHACCWQAGDSFVRQFALLCSTPTAGRRQQAAPAADMRCVPANAATCRRCRLLRPAAAAPACCLGHPLLPLPPPSTPCRHPGRHQKGHAGESGRLHPDAAGLPGPAAAGHRGGDHHVRLRILAFLLDFFICLFIYLFISREGQSRAGAQLGLGSGLGCACAGAGLG